MGVVSIAVPSADLWYFTELLRGAGQRIDAAGHVQRLHVIAPSPTATAEAVAALSADFARPDSVGGITTGFKYQAEPSTKALTWKRPVVAVGGSVVGFPTVMIDDIGAARLATGHLIELGHSKITHFAGTAGNQRDFLFDSRRVKGYRSAMGGAGLEPVVVDCGYDPATVYRTAHELLQRHDRPTAVFALSDEVAFGVLAAARALGLRPGHDLSVVGIDGQPQSEAAGLTTVRQVPAEIGATAVDLLLSGLSHGPDPKQSRLHPVSLVKRSSTGPLRAAVTGSAR